MYFKILAEDLTHHGYTYHEGLNVDPNPFDPRPECEGGLFFTDENHVFEFYDCEDKIAKVTIPDGETVIQVGNEKFKAKKIILGEIKELWTAKTFKWLNDCGVDLHINDDRTLRLASHEGHLDVVKYLIERGAHIHGYNDYAVRYAAEGGNLDVVKYLVKQGADIHAEDESALILATKAGKLETVKYLVERGADIHIDDDLALYKAIHNYDLDMIKYLIEQGANIDIVDRKWLSWIIVTDHENIEYASCMKIRVDKK